MSLSKPTYFEDLDVYASYKSDEITITAEEIRKYANQFDPQPYHTDRSAAKDSIFGGPVSYTHLTLPTSYAV